jgi:hypothetical protein
MWHFVDLVRPDILEERVTPIFRVERIHELGTTSALNSRLPASYIVPSSQILSILKMETTCSSKTSVVTRSTWHHIPEDSILHNLI